MMREHHYHYEGVGVGGGHEAAAGEPNNNNNQKIVSGGFLLPRPAAAGPVIAVVDSSSKNQKKGHGSTGRTSPYNSNHHSHHSSHPNHCPHHSHHHNHSHTSRCHPLLRMLAELGVAFFAVLSLMQSLNVSSNNYYNYCPPSSFGTFTNTKTTTTTLTSLDPLHLSTLPQQQQQRPINATTAAAAAIIPRNRQNVAFLYPRAPPGQTDAYSQTWFKEVYSGMWWQTSAQFVDTDWNSAFYSMPITASLKALKRGRARQTRDWLDLAVEHLSIFWKHFDYKPARKDQAVYAAIEEGIRAYTYRTLTADATAVPEIPSGSAAPHTLALLPFAGQSGKQDSPLRLWSLAATLVSLWQIGVRRSVVVGHTDDEAHMVQQAFDTMLQILQSQRSQSSSAATNATATATTAASDFYRAHPMELHFLKIANVTEEEAKLMPRVALRSLQVAMKKVGNGMVDDEEVTEWFGEHWQPLPSEDSTNLDNSNNNNKKPASSSAATAATATRFRYIYFTEPDLILHTRPSAMDAIRREMDRGGVFSAHRFMPLPHQRSFPNYDNWQKVLPDVGRFSDIRQLHDAVHSCCDAGEYYPSNPTNPGQPVPSYPCGTYLPWWRCGYFQKNISATDGAHADVALVSQLHRRVPQPLVSLARGTGWPLIHNNQRVCFPQQFGACDTTIDGQQQRPQEKS